MIGKYYKLNADKEVVECEVLEAFEVDRTVMKSGKPDEINVSTVFLAIPHSGGMFETMIFNDDTDEEYQERCETYEAALEQHKRACQHIGIEIGKVVSELEKDFMENLKKI